MGKLKTGVKIAQIEAVLNQAQVSDYDLSSILSPAISDGALVKTLKEKPVYTGAALDAIENILAMDEDPTAPWKPKSIVMTRTVSAIARLIDNRTPRNEGDWSKALGLLLQIGTREAAAETYLLAGYEKLGVRAPFLNRIGRDEVAIETLKKFGIHTTDIENIARKKLPVHAPRFRY